MNFSLGPNAVSFLGATTFEIQSGVEPRSRCGLSGRAPIRQRQNPRLFRTVIERMKASNLIEPPMSIERVEVMRVACGQLACLQITAAQVCIAKCLRTLAGEKMKAQPAPVHTRDSLGFSKERNKQEENEIGIHLRLELQIARKILGSDLASSVFELERRMQCVIEFFHERDQ